LGGKDAHYTLIHVVETVGAILYGSSIKDHETTVDEQLLYEYTRLLSDKGFSVQTQLGFGKPGKPSQKSSMKASSICSLWAHMVTGISRI
jgi:manganese transport protein